MAGNEHRNSPYRSPPQSPYRSPPIRSPDISAPKGVPVRYSQQDLRTRVAPSLSDPKVISQRKGDQARGSRYAFDRLVDRYSSQRSEPLDVQPIRSLAPAAPSSSLEPKRSQKIASTKGPLPKDVDLARNAPVKRKAFEMSPPKQSLGKAPSTEVTLPEQVVVHPPKN